MERIVIEKENICIIAEWQMLGKDLAVLLYGGDTPHIGAASCRSVKHEQDKHAPGRSENPAASGNAAEPEYGFVLPEHRDDVVTSLVADKLSARLGLTVCVIGGIHIDDITKAQIIQIQVMCEEIAERILEHV